ncbi:Uncharacterised protein [Mycobacteroides abscessus]|nr:Uncharacterised protein [Mycobacteroides abscessus]
MMSMIVGSMISVTTLLLKTLLATRTSRSWISGSVSGPNSGPTKVRLPKMPSSSGGNDNTCQKAACADCAKIESSQLFTAVRRITCKTSRPNETWRGFSLMATPAFLMGWSVVLTGGETAVTNPRAGR